MRPDREAFRAWVRVHHPDAGGDPEEFVAGLELWRAGNGRPDAPARVQVTVFRSRGGLWLLARWLRRRHRDRRRVL